MRRHALAAVVTSTIAIAVAYALAFVPGGAAAGAWVMAVGLATMIVALMVLGAVRQGESLGALRLPLAVTFVFVAGCFLAALALPDETATSRIVLGLPVRAAIVIYGVGLVPLILLPIAYARTFESMTLDDDDIARVRAARAAADATDHGRGDA